MTVPQSPTPSTVDRRPCAMGGGSIPHPIDRMMLRRAECLSAALLAPFKAVELAGAPIWRPMGQTRALDKRPLRFVAHRRPRSKND